MGVALTFRHIPLSGKLLILQGSQVRETVSHLHKMHLLTLILGIVLLPKVTSLKCYQCMGDGTCTTAEMSCVPGQTKCGSMSVLTYAGGSKISEFQMKSCTSPAECIQGSVNFGISSIQIASQCCTSDLCNANAAPAPKDGVVNGLKCHTCNGQTCDATMNCKGDEDRCISAELPAGDSKMKMMGCASNLMCSQVNNPQLKMALGESFSCCEGNYCNGPKTRTGSQSPRNTSVRQHSSLSAGLLMLPTLLLLLVASS